SSATPSILFTGGGEVILNKNISVTQTHQNGRVTVGESTARTTLTLAADSSTITAHRLYVDHGVVNVNDGAIININNSAASGATRSALQIGNTANSSETNTPSV